MKSGCRDCKKCTNSAVVNLGRNAGRLSAGIMTVGMSELGMAFTKNCSVCGHKLNLHQSADAVLTSPQAPPPAPGPAYAPGWYELNADGVEHWHDGTQYTGQTRTKTPTVAASSTPPATTDVNTELSRLAEFHKQGVLTDEEFAAAKKKLLGI